MEKAATEPLNAFAGPGAIAPLAKGKK